MMMGIFLGMNFLLQPTPKFARIDTNGDGAISKEEHVATKREKFARDWM